MTELRDRKPPAEKPSKKDQEAISAFLSSGLDLTPLTLDPGDGTEWKFKGDPMPADIARITDAQKAIRDTEENDGDITAAFETLIEAIRELLIEPSQKEQFPKPNYGVNAMIWFAGNISRGKNGLPIGPA